MVSAGGISGLALASGFCGAVDHTQNVRIRSQLGNLDAVCRRLYAEHPPAVTDFKPALKPSLSLWPRRPQLRVQHNSLRNNEPSV